MNKSNQSSNCVKLQLDMEKLKTVVTIDDFFKSTGIEPYLKDKSITEVRQMVMNSVTGEQVLEFMKKNWKKNKSIKKCSKEHAMFSINFLWLDYSPVYNSEVPEGYIYIYPNK